MLDLLKISVAPFLELLSEPVADRIRLASTLVKYADGQLIHSRGAQKPGLSIIASGSARMGIYGIDGSFVITATLGIGETFGEFTLFTDLPRTHDVFAEGKTEIYQLSGNSFNTIYEQEPEIARALLKTTLSRTHLLLEMLDSIRRLPIREQTARILLSMTQPASTSDTLKCLQSDLAFTLGVSRVSLNRALGNLTELGLIRLGYGQIEVPSVPRLRAWVNQQCGATQLS